MLLSKDGSGFYGIAGVLFRNITVALEPRLQKRPINNKPQTHWPHAYVRLMLVLQQTVLRQLVNRFLLEPFG